MKGAKDAAAGRAYGRLQVVDVSNIEKPKSVAWYEPEYGGVHNVWVAGDTLYMARTTPGSARSTSAVSCAATCARSSARSCTSTRPTWTHLRSINEANTWGVVVRDGLAYVNDNHNGLVDHTDPARSARKTVAREEETLRQLACPASRYRSVHPRRPRVTTSFLSRPRPTPTEITLIALWPGAVAPALAAGARTRRVRYQSRSEPDGPHGLAVAPDGAHVLRLHGARCPNGYLWKFSTAGDTALGSVELGNVSRDHAGISRRLLRYVVNFNLHGDMVPSSVSVVHTTEMMEVARIQTCTMPHGSRFNAQGTQAILGVHDG